MNKKLWVALVICMVALPLAMLGCKGKTEKMPEEMKMEPMDTSMVTTTTQEAQVVQMTEPAASVASETIPPTAAPETAQIAPAAAPSAGNKNVDIQTALKNAGFYSGAIDGKIGPKTKAAIVAFQKAKGLAADGKVGPKTMAELEKYLSVTPQ